MPISTRRLLTVVVVLTVASLVGFVLSWIFQWPSTFVLGKPADDKVTLEDLVAGTPLSIPLTPWLVMLAVAFVARFQRWWGAIATALLAVMGCVFIGGGLGEAFGDPNPYAPELVLHVASVVWVLLGASLVIAALADLARRFRDARRRARAAD